MTESVEHGHRPTSPPVWLPKDMDYTLTDEDERILEEILPAMRAAKAQHDRPGSLKGKDPDTLLAEHGVTLSTDSRRWHAMSSELLRRV